MNLENIEITTLYQNQIGSIFQNDSKLCFSIHTNSIRCDLAPCQLLEVKEILNCISLQEIFEDQLDSNLVCIPHLDILWLINTSELVYLLDLMNGTFFMLSLNSTLNRYDISHSVFEDTLVKSN